MFRMRSSKKIDPNQKIKPQPASTYFVLFLALGAMTFFGVCNPATMQSGPTGIAATVEDQKVTNTEFRRQYIQYSDNLKRTYGEKYDPSTLKVAAKVLDQLVKDRILYLKAKEYGTIASDNEIVDSLSEAQVFKDKDGNYSADRFRQYLRYNQYSEVSFRQEMERRLSLQKLRNLITQTVHSSSKEIEAHYKIKETKLTLNYLQIKGDTLDVPVEQKDISDFKKQKDHADQVKKWYEDNKKDYITEKEVEASHVLIAYKGARNASGTANKRSKSEAQAYATKVLKDLKKDGADFAKIARLETDEPKGKTNGGKLGFFSRKTMVKEFSDVAFNLKANEISDVVESPFGFHIIKVTGIKPAKNISLEQATEEIIKGIISKNKRPQILEQKTKQIFAALKKDGNIKKTLKDNNLQWSTTKEFALDVRYIPGIGANQEVISEALKLNKKDQLCEAPIKSGENYYIIQLNNLTKADMNKFDENQKKAIERNLKFSEGYSYFNRFAAAVNDQYKSSIYLNPEYLELDNTPEEGL